MFRRQLFGGLLMVIMSNPNVMASDNRSHPSSSKTDRDNIVMLDRMFQSREGGLSDPRNPLEALNSPIPVHIEGTQRIQNHAIISRLSLPTSHAELNDEELVQNTVRTLGESGLFSQVEARFDNGRLNISVKENPAINQVGFEGNKAFKEEQLLQQCAAIKPRRVLSVSAIREALDIMQGSYRAMGYYAAVIKPQLVWREANRVDVLFQIQEGKKAEIRKIIIVGNRVLSTKYLKSYMQSRERMSSGLLSKLIVGGRSLFSSETAHNDQQRLRDIYIFKGYLNAHVSDALVELDPSKTKVVVTYNVAEGERFTFGKTTTESEHPDAVPVSIAKPTYSWRPGYWVNVHAIEACANRMTKAIQKAGHPFYEVDVQKKINGTTVDVKFIIRSTLKRYVGRIHITGNNITHDRVVRRALVFQEGDALTSIKHKESKARLGGLGIFDAAEIVTDQDASTDRGDATIRVKEAAHSKINGGISYDNLHKFGVNLNWTDKNVLGTGNQTSVGGVWARNLRTVNAGVLAPRFLERNMTVLSNVSYTDTKEYTIDEESSKGAYYTREGSSTISMSYALNQNKNLIQTWSYVPSIQKVGDLDKTGGPVSPYIVNNLKGHELLFCSQVQHSLGMNKQYPVNNHIFGWGWVMNNNVAGVGGGTQFALNSVGLNSFYSFGSQNKWRLRGNLQGSILNPLGYVRFNNALNLGGLNFPGFSEKGIGPRDATTKEALGGKFLYVGSLKLDFPLPSSADLPLNGCLHVHTGSVWGTIFDDQIVTENSIDSLTINNRVSVGFGFFVAVPKMGNMGFVYSKPLVKNKKDRVNYFELVISKQF